MVAAALQGEKAGANEGQVSILACKYDGHVQHCPSPKINDSDVIAILQDPQCVFSYISMCNVCFYRALAVMHARGHRQVEGCGLNYTSKCIY